MEVLNKKLLAYFPNDTFYLFYFINILSMFFTIAILFTIIFKALPDGKVVIKDCLIGACFTAFLFMIGKFGIGAYLSSTSIATTYGAAGSIILILIWVYYSAIILYFGAVFTKVYATNHGHKIIPNDYSVLIIEQNIEIEAKSVLINSNYVE
jgi:membrane protein